MARFCPQCRKLRVARWHAYALEGFIIEYSYTVTSPMSVEIKPNTWHFQGSVPFK